MIKLVQNSDSLASANESSVIIAFPEDSSVLDLRQTLISLTNQSTTSFQIFAQHDTELTDNISFKNLKQYRRPGILILKVQEDRDGFHIYVKVLASNRAEMVLLLEDDDLRICDMWSGVSFEFHM